MLRESEILTIVAFIFLAPLIGFVLGVGIMLAVYWIFHRQRPDRVDRLFRWGQLLSSAAFSLGHGGNDAQKTMAIITVAMAVAFPAYQTNYDVKVWVILSAYTAIALGTLLGGWKVVRTMGTRLTKLRPVQGFCAESAGAVVLLGTTLTGIPVSTTHSITGSILGVGAVKRFSAVRWGIATRILWTWILTIPCTALASGLLYALLDLAGILGADA